jgi:hypothetical protein
MALFAFSVWMFPLAAPAAKPLPKKDAEFKKANIGTPLTERDGANSKVWDEFVRMAGEYEDTDVMNALFKARVGSEGSGQPLAAYRFDLFSVFRANPNFFARAANAHYAGNLDCAVDLLVPASGVLPFYEVENAAKKVKKPDALLTKFMTRAKEHDATLRAQKESTLKLEGCR